MALDIVPITLAEANEFVRQKHRHHGKVAGHKFSIAVADVETSKIVGVAIVGRPVSRFLDDRQCRNNHEKSYQLVKNSPCCHRKVKKWKERFGIEKAGEKI